MMFVSVLLIGLALGAIEVRSKTVPLFVLNHGDTVRYPDCHSLRHTGYTETGNYLLHIDGEPTVKRCPSNDFITIIQRKSGDIKFDRSFEDYEYGFSDVSGSTVWAGLLKIHRKVREVITRKPYIYISMVDWKGNFHSCKYDKFYVSDKDNGYRLTVDEFQEMGPGKIGDMLKSNNGAEFHTVDRPDPNGCSRKMHGGWWYKGQECAEALPTGRYYEGGYYNKTGQMWDGIFWKGAFGYGYSFKTFSITLGWD